MCRSPSSCATAMTALTSTLLTHRRNYSGISIPRVSSHHIGHNPGVTPYLAPGLTFVNAPRPAPPILLARVPGAGRRGCGGHDPEFGPLVPCVGPHDDRARQDRGDHPQETAGLHGSSQSREQLLRGSDAGAPLLGGAAWRIPAVTGSPPVHGHPSWKHTVVVHTQRCDRAHNAVIVLPFMLPAPCVASHPLGAAAPSNDFPLTLPGVAEERGLCHRKNCSGSQPRLRARRLFRVRAERVEQA